MEKIERIKLLDRKFKTMIPAEEIDKVVAKVAESSDRQVLLLKQTTVLVVVLNAFRESSIFSLFTLRFAILFFAYVDA